MTSAAVNNKNISSIFLQVVVNFGSSWCAHCHKLFPHVLSLTHVFTKLHYAVAQVDFMKEAPRGITYTPTLVVFDKGRKIDQFFGSNPQQLRDRLWLHSD
jgi:thioredoxin-like negative regulator of GroEL